MTSSTFNEALFKAWANPLRERFEAFADRELTTSNPNLALLSEAMRYAVLGGGKRVRALLVYAAGALTGGENPVLDHVALALECVHAYSLIHDDLPCMDNDSLRRGKPTCHVKYGYAEAMLAGDALQPEAYLHLVGLPIAAAQQVELVKLLSEASGLEGMCGGQLIDLTHVGKPMTLEHLREMHLKKTGALIRASILMGAMCGEAGTYRAVQPYLETYSSLMGLGFQVIDDVLDVISDAETLGKTAGKDAANVKPTYVTLMGLEASRALAHDCLKGALAALDAMKADTGPVLNTDALEHLAHYIIGRDR